MAKKTGGKKSITIDYPLTYEQLEEYKFYECDNGTIVYLLSSYNFNSKIGDSGLVVNIANGVGNYKIREHHYKLLSTGYVCIDLTSSGTAYQGDSHFFPM